MTMLSSERTAEMTGGEGWLWRRSSPPSRASVLVLVVAAVLAIIVADLAYAAEKHAAPRYQTSAVLSFDEPQAFASAGDAGQIDKVSRLRLKYAGLLRTDAVLEPVANSLGLPIGKVRGSLVTFADQQSLLLSVGAQSSDAAQARRIASALGDALVSYVSAEQDKFKVPASQRLDVQVAIPAPAAQQVAPTKRKLLTVAVVAGALTFAAVLGAATLVRRRRRV